MLWSGWLIVRAVGENHVPGWLLLAFGSFLSSCSLLHFCLLMGAWRRWIWNASNWEWEQLSVCTTQSVSHTSRIWSSCRDHRASEMRRCRSWKEECATRQRKEFAVRHVPSDKSAPLKKTVKASLKRRWNWETWTRTVQNTRGFRKICWRGFAIRSTRRSAVRRAPDAPQQLHRFSAKFPSPSYHNLGGILTCFLPGWRASYHGSRRLSVTERSALTSFLQDKCKNILKTNLLC